MVLCLLLTLAAASVLTFTTTPQYASSAQIFVSTSPSDASQAYQGNLFATQRITSYAKIVTTRKLATKVADDLGTGLTPDELRDEVTAAVDPDTVILTITATDPDAAQARDIAQAYAEELSTYISNLETTGKKQIALVKASIIDNAEIGTTPVSPRPVRNLGLAFVLGLLLGVGIAVLRELLDTSISSAEDVEEVTTAPLLGHIGADPNAVKTSPAVVLNDITPWAESFRVLRTNMQYVEVDRDRRVFVVSSSLPSEGKSTTAVSLAVTLALAGQRVALVECDLRRPLIANRLSLDTAVGTTSVLIGKVALADAMQSYEDTGLQVLASGPIPPNPSELLQSGAMDKMLRELRDQFEVVILDAPPLLPVTDAALLAAQADGALVVVRHGKTTHDQLRHAIERIEAVDAKVIGVVINLAPARRVGRGYGYGYGYGYSYGYSYKPLEATVNDDGSAKRAQDGHRRGRRKPRS